MPALLPSLLALLITLATLNTRATAAPMPTTFGIGHSQYLLTTNETAMFTHTLPSTTTTATMTHFWATGDANIDTAIWRYYIDGEPSPSIQFTSAQATGVGFLDQTAPWGSQWIGKGAADGAWYCNFRVPFGRSVRVTGQLAPGTGESGTLWASFRGSENLPVVVAGYVLPASARLVQARIEGATYQPLEFVTVANVSTAYNGVLWAHYLTANSTTLNFLEGCYHSYSPPSTPFPGFIYSTGTEDYYDSAFYFNAGLYHTDIAGLTHYFSNDTHSEISAYRLHDSDPLFFKNGFRFEWRVGDVSDANGLKCTSVKGTVSGNPQPTTITTYTWVYVWPAGDELSAEERDQQLPAASRRTVVQ